MRITREIACLDWVQFGLKTGVCFCQECGHIDPEGVGHYLCPVCHKTNRYLTGEKYNGQRYQTENVYRSQDY